MKRIIFLIVVLALVTTTAGVTAQYPYPTPPVSPTATAMPTFQPTAWASVTPSPTATFAPTVWPSVVPTVTPTFVSTPPPPPTVKNYAPASARVWSGVEIGFTGTFLKWNKCNKISFGRAGGTAIYTTGQRVTHMSDTLVEIFVDPLGILPGNYTLRLHCEGPPRTMIEVGPFTFKP